MHASFLFSYEERHLNARVGRKDTLVKINMQYTTLVCFMFGLILSYNGSWAMTQKQDSNVLKTIPCTWYDSWYKLADCQYRYLNRVPDNIRMDVEIINLSYNVIRTLYNSSFIHYTHLLELYLTNNDIRMIEGGTFFPLRSLYRLDLGQVPNLKVPNSNFFQYSHNLSYIMLYSCDLTSFPVELIQHLPQLIEINLHV